LLLKKRLPKVSILKVIKKGKPMTNNTPEQEYCQVLEKMCANGQMKWESAYFLLRGFFYETCETLTKAIEVLEAVQNKKYGVVETQTEFGTVKVEQQRGGDIL